MKDFVKNHSFAICLLTSFVNLFYMHYYISTPNFTYSRIWDLTFFIPTICLSLYDFSIIAFFASVLLIINRKTFLLIFYIISFLISISNVLYFRYFGMYMLPNCWSEFYKRVGTGFFSSYIASSFEYTDMLYLLTITAFIIVFLKLRDNCNYHKYVNLLVVILLPFILSPLFNYLDSKFRGIDPKFKSYYQYGDIKAKASLYPNSLCKQYGIIQLYLLSFVNHDNIKLSIEDENLIYEYIVDNNQRNSCYLQKNSKNCVFIIVESLLSSAISDSIMPTLFSLKENWNSYFNPNVHSNITIGESGDGQFVLMSGLLPLCNSFTVSVADSKEIIGLPSVFKKHGYNTMITIPTTPDEWNQQSMSNVYGFENQNSTFDLNNQPYISDSLVFDLAIKKENEIKQPFFHTILTLDMHSPYTNESYISKCKSTDKAISKYIDSLNDRGILDNTIIILAADHYAHLELLGIEDCFYNKLTPLIITNIKNESMFIGDIEQLDIYPTILSVFGFKEQQNIYTGLGTSVYNYYKSNSNIDFLYSISEKIIKGNYFSTYIKNAAQ